MNVEFNKQTDIKIPNEKIKGSIKIIKQDAENPDNKISGVKFELYDEELNLLETLETDRKSVV